MPVSPSREAPPARAVNGLPVALVSPRPSDRPKVSLGRVLRRPGAADAGLDLEDPETRLDSDRRRAGTGRFIFALASPIPLPSANLRCSCCLTTSLVTCLAGALVAVPGLDNNLAALADYGLRL